MKSHHQWFHTIMYHNDDSPDFPGNTKVAKNMLLGLNLVCIYYCKLRLWISLDWVCVCVCLWLISHAAEMDRFASHQRLASFLPQITPGGLVALGCSPPACQHTLITLGIWFCFSVKSARRWHSRMSDVSHITRGSPVTACTILTLWMRSAGFVAVWVESAETGFGINEHGFFDVICALRFWRDLESKFFSVCKFGKIPREHLDAVKYYYIVRCMELHSS